MPRVPFRRYSNKGFVTKKEFAGVRGGSRVSIMPPKCGYWKYAKRAVRYLISKHKELIDCPSDAQPKILELGHESWGGMRLYITFQVPRSDGYTADYEALVFVWPARQGADIRAFKKIEGSEKLIEISDTTTAGEDRRILSPPSSDDEGMGPVPRPGHTEDSFEDADEDSVEDADEDSVEDVDEYSVEDADDEDSGEYAVEDSVEDAVEDSVKGANEDNNEVRTKKGYFLNGPVMEQVHTCPLDSEYWSEAKEAVYYLMDVHKDVMDYLPGGRPKILELFLRGLDNDADGMLLYIAFEVPKRNGYTTDYEAVVFVWSRGMSEVMFKDVQNSERPIGSSDFTGGSMVSDDRSILSPLSFDEEANTMDSGSGYGDEYQGDGSMMCVDADDDLNKSGTGVLSKDETYIEKDSMMEHGDDANISEKEKVAFLGEATERLNIM